MVHRLSPGVAGASAVRFQFASGNQGSVGGFRTELYTDCIVAVDFARDVGRGIVAGIGTNNSLSSGMRLESNGGNGLPQRAQVEADAVGFPLVIEQTKNATVDSDLHLLLQSIAVDSKFAECVCACVRACLRVPTAERAGGQALL